MHRSPTKASRQDPDRKTRVTLAISKPLRADNQGLSATTPSYQQTLEARGKNPSKDEENASSLTTNCRNCQAKTTRTREGRVPPEKKAGTPVGPQPTNPSPNKRQRQKPRRGTTEGEGATIGQGDRTVQQRPHQSSTHRSSRRGHRPVTTQPTARAGEGQKETRKVDNHKGQPRLQTSQRTGAVNTAGQKCTHPKARESKQGTAQPPRKSRTAGGDDRTTNKTLEASRAQ